LAPGVLAISPVNDNVVDAEAFGAAVASIGGSSPASRKQKQKAAALLIPDFAARLAVIDFDSFPSNPEEQQALVRFRIKKTAPFDVDGAVISFQAQPRSGSKGSDVIVAAVAMEIAARYEQPFRLAGFHTGLVTTSSLAMLHLVEDTAVTAAARLSGRVMTIAALAANHLRLVRTVELEAVAMDEICSVVFPTFAYMEDELKCRPEKVQLCGFGAIQDPLAETLSAEAQVRVEPMRSRLGTPEAHNAGLLGYLESATAA
jgi:type IV pilus assembly protein PilM